MWKQIWQFVFGNPVVKKWGADYPSYLVKHLEAAEAAHSKANGYTGTLGYIPAEIKDSVKSVLTKTNHELGRYNESIGVGPDNYARQWLARIRSEVAKMPTTNPNA